MNKNLLLLATLLLSGISLSAQRIADYTWTDATPVSFVGYTKTTIEHPPWIIPGSWRTYLFGDGGSAYVGSSPESMITHINGQITPTAPIQVTTPSGCNTADYWRTHYYVTISAQYFYHPAQGWVTLGFVDGENHTASDIGHPVDCNYTDWDGHAGFTCGAWAPNNESTNWGNQFYTDLGPLVWPSTGYFDANHRKVGNGCANNATIQVDGYIYVFYKDQSNFQNMFSAEGREPGIKVARAPISDALNPQAYKSYYKDPVTGVVQWNPSLPPGFDKYRINDFLYGSVGPKASVILDNTTHDYTRFAVARVEGKPYYFGVGSYEQNGHKIMNLMWSSDLVTWQDERTIDWEESWSSSVFNYPIFLDKEGWSNTSIDENDFYLVGTNGGITHTAWLLHMKLPPLPPVCYDNNGNVITCPPPPPPPDPVCYDNEGHIIDCSNTVRRAVAGPGSAPDVSRGGAPIVTPNPGPGIYQVKYAVSTPSTTQLNVFDLMGRRLQTGQAMTHRPGAYTETVNISGQAKGVYLLELVVNGKRKTFKVVYQ